MGGEYIIHLSIVTVVKDDLYGFLKTANSLLAQKSREFQWVIVDGSSDNKIQESLDYKLKSQLNIKYLKQKPDGIYAAMNAGWKNSSGTHIWFINAGDFLTTSSAINNLLEKTTPDNSLIVFPTIHINSNNLIYALSFPKVTALKNGQLVAEINHQGTICSKLILEKFGGFKDILKYAEDGRFLDFAIKNSEPLMLKKPMIAFAFGGASTLNFRQVISEIETYRFKKNKLENIILLIKTKIRVILFHKKFFGLMDMLVDKYYSKKINKSIIEKEIDLTDLDLLLVRNKILNGNKI
jgi:glycosyltransferase involved in cell wall biosynthesis